jgi:succinate dehydrogenase/fumarate reductase flavoprotein subunit
VTTPGEEAGSQPIDADVVVVGAGPAGLAAAVAAADGGASVTVLEALGEIGGNALWSTGYLAFCDTDAQHSLGIEDDVESFVSDAAAEVARQRERYGIVWDEALTRLFAARSAATYEFLRRHGVTFERFIPRPEQHTIDRMLVLSETRSLQRAFAAALAERDVEIVLDTRARRLLQSNGRVNGVVIEGAAGTGRVLATRGVVLATGGYQAGIELRRRYQPEHLAVTPYLGVSTCRGDGHRMGERIGGDLLNMTMIQPLVIVASALVEDSIAVNSAGRRFHDEAGPYDDRVAALLDQPERLAYYVFDRRTADTKGHLVDQMPEPPIVAKSFYSLAEAIGCPVGELERTVAEWNESITADAPIDDKFGRVVLPADRRGIVEPPFAACRMVLGVNFPAGGFRTTNEMAVVDVDGVPIPGLWAAGDTVGGVNPCLGLGGIHISSALTLGFVAGSAAAADRVGSVHPLPAVNGPPVPRLPVEMAIVAPPNPP